MLRSWAEHRNPQIRICPNQENAISTIEIVKKFLNPATNENMAKDYMTFSSLNSDLKGVFGKNYEHARSKLFWGKCVQMANMLTYFPLMEKGRLKSNSYVWVSVVPTENIPNILFRNAINVGITNTIGTSRGLIQDQRGFHYSWENVLEVRFENRGFWGPIYQTMTPQIDENFKKWVGNNFDYMQKFASNIAYFETIAFVSYVLAILQMLFLIS